MTRHPSHMSASIGPVDNKRAPSFGRDALRFGVPVGLFVAAMYQVKYFGCVFPTTVKQVGLVLVTVILGVLAGYLLAIWNWRSRKDQT